MSPFEMYLIMQMDSIRIVMTIFVVLSLIATFGLGMGWGLEGDQYKRPLIKAASATAIVMFLSAVAPSTKSLLVIYGVSAISDIEGIDKLPNKSVQAIDKLLSDYLEGADK